MSIKMWVGLFERGFAVAGFTLFSTAMTQGFCKSNITSAAIAGGLYLFVEAMRAMKIDTTQIKNKKANFSFLIF
jgi:small neutral amino acid transporter SnatA (MarC family)